VNPGGVDENVEAAHAGRELLECTPGLRIIQVIAGNSVDGGQEIRGGDASPRGKHLETGLGKCDGDAAAHTSACSGDHGGGHLFSLFHALQ
jgi:hypothetical protein